MVVHTKQALEILRGHKWVFVFLSTVVFCSSVSQYCGDSLWLVPLECVVLSCPYRPPSNPFSTAQAFLPTGSQGHFCSSWVSVSGDLASCSPHSVSLILGTAVCPVSSSVIRIQEYLLIFQFVQFSACCLVRVAMPMLFTCRTPNWKSAVLSV